MAKKIFSIEELGRLSAEEVIDKIQHSGYSLLKTLGAEKMRREMVPVGKICNAAINYVLGTTGPMGISEEHTRAARAKLTKRLKKVAPGTYEGFPQDKDTGLVVGFNHPSLGEIARILMMKMDVMGEKPMLFPVNLPWYEALATDYDRIRQLGIIITPTITPSTWIKMGLRKNTPEFEAGSRLKREFRELYTRLSHEVLKEGGVIFVAPSATRQKTVFLNKEIYDKKEPIIPTMSVLALELYSDPDIKCEFLPMAVLPPEGYKKGLNFFKEYQLIPGKRFTAKEIREKYLKDNQNAEKLPEFDWDFHKRIAEKLPREFWY
ncbi:hypothetical protein IKE83_02555 [Candidatus Saccharibacteria bacterium]|nr:hypothetical protein [Candidatus Saccharibacteria bacterium]